MFRVGFRGSFIVIDTNDVGWPSWEFPYGRMIKSRSCVVWVLLIIYVHNNINTVVLLQSAEETMCLNIIYM